MDRFHPDHQPGPDGRLPDAPAPRRGGRVVLHLNARPGSWNPMVDNNAVVRAVQATIHESLLERDLATWEFRSYLASRWDVEDRLVARRPDGSTERLLGRVEPLEGGYRVTPVAPENALGGPRRVEDGDVVSLDRGVAFTFRLRPDVLWHDGHPFDAHDVVFSWRCYRNPTVDCDHDRAEIGAFEEATALDAHTVRFVGREQYFGYRQALANLVLLPAHLYDLSDPENPDHDAAVDPLGERQGRYVNENPHNRLFVGLGPYRVVSADLDHVDAERFEGYFDPDPAHGRAGWVDAIRWRVIPDLGTARTALLQGELDYFEGLSSSDYFGAFTHQPAFTGRYYAGYSYRPQMQYVAWNLRRPELADRRVRVALAEACDWDAFLSGIANGLGVRVTGTTCYGHPSYDTTLAPLPFDPDHAAELLDEAGWIDRDGDGVRDRDGRPLAIEFLADAGGGVGSLYGRVLQEGLGRIGVRLEVTRLDSAALYERIREKDFDAFSRSWFLDPENDPIQVWGRWTGDPAKDRSTNYPGWGTAESDAAIERIRRTVDDASRWALERALQRRIFADQPYLFLFEFPVKFAVARRVRGVRAYGLQPGIAPREWWVVGP